MRDFFKQSIIILSVDDSSKCLLLTISPNKYFFCLNDGLRSLVTDDSILKNFNLNPFELTWFQCCGEGKRGAGVKFINVFLHAFFIKNFGAKNYKAVWSTFVPNFGAKKVLSYKKCAHKILIKLTPAVNFSNIIRTCFSYKFFDKAKM